MTRRFSRGSSESRVVPRGRFDSANLIPSTIPPWIGVLSNCGARGPITPASRSAIRKHSDPWRDRAGNQIRAVEAPPGDDPGFTRSAGEAPRHLLERRKRSGGSLGGRTGSGSTSREDVWPRAIDPGRLLNDHFPLHIRVEDALEVEFTGLIGKRYADTRTGFEVDRVPRSRELVADSVLDHVVVVDGDRASRLGENDAGNETIVFNRAVRNRAAGPGEVQAEPEHPVFRLAGLQMANGAGE